MIAAAPRALGPALGGAALGAGAVTAGAAGVLGAYYVHPLAVPAALLALALGAVTLQRPEIGIAAWFVMLPLGVLGMLGPLPWLVPTAWAALLFVLALTRAPQAGGVALPPLGLGMVLVVVVTVVGSAWTPTLDAALPIVRTALSGAFVFFAIATLVRTRDEVLWILGAMAAAAALVGAVAVREYVGGGASVGFFTSSGELVARVTAGFGQPNQLGGFLVLLVPPIVAGALVARRGRLLFGIAAALAVAGIVYSFSRGALLALAAAPLAFLGLRRALLLAPAAGALLLVAAPDLVRERFATLSADGSELASRADMWRVATDIWQANPLVGVGPGGFPDAYAAVQVPGKEFLPDTFFEPPPHAHNVVLQLLSEQGLVGLLVVGGLVVIAAGGLLRARRSTERWVRMTAAGLLGALLAFAVHNVFDVTLLEGTGQYLWALLGLASVLVAHTREEDALSGQGSATGPP